MQIKLYIESDDGIDIYGKYDEPVVYYSLQSLHDDIYEMEVAAQKFQEERKRKIEEGIEAKPEVKKEFTENEKREIGDWAVGRDINGVTINK